MSLPERFWAKVNKTDTCWLWTASLSGKGYSQFYYEGKLRLGHRVAYIDQFGEPPAGLDLDHVCRVRICVNPDHLEAVTRAENLRRSPLTFSGKTHCPQGHPYAGENLKVIRHKRGGSGVGRSCRECARASSRKYAAKRKAARVAARQQS